jgi:hypothetical protein
MATKSGTTKKHSSGAPGTAHTAAERSAVNKLVARDAASSPVRLKLVKDGGVLRLDVDYPDDVAGTALLMDALATGDVEFMNGAISQLGKAASKDGEVSEAEHGTASAVRDWYGQAPPNRRGKPCRPSMFRITHASCSTHKVSGQSLELRKRPPPSKRKATPSWLRRGDASKRH